MVACLGGVGSTMAPGSSVVLDADGGAMRGRHAGIVRRSQGFGNTRRAGGAPPGRIPCLAWAGGWYLGPPGP